MANPEQADAFHAVGLVAGTRRHLPGTHAGYLREMGQLVKMQTYASLWERIERNPLHRINSLCLLALYDPADVELSRLSRPPYPGSSDISRPALAIEETDDAPPPQTPDIPRAADP
ncbi:hypothetical protein KXV85_001042, partial [Aspergillus fumigatus]